MSDIILFFALFQETNITALTTLISCKKDRKEGQFVAKCLYTFIKYNLSVRLLS